MCCWRGEHGEEYSGMLQDVENIMTVIARQYFSLLYGICFIMTDGMNDFIQTILQKMMMN